MKIQTKKINHLCGHSKCIIIIDGEPIVSTNKESQANMLIAYINGVDADIKDKKLKRLLDSYRTKRNDEEKDTKNKKMPSEILRETNENYRNLFKELVERYWKPQFIARYSSTVSQRVDIMFRYTAFEFDEESYIFPLYYHSAAHEHINEIIYQFIDKDHVVDICERHKDDMVTCELLEQIQNDLNTYLNNEICNSHEVIKTKYIMSVLTDVAEREI